MADKNRGEVWSFNGAKLQRIEGAKLGERMVTMPSGQRWSREGHGLTDQYAPSEAEAARMIEPYARRQVAWAKKSLAEAEAAVAECARVLGDKTES